MTISEITAKIVTMQPPASTKLSKIIPIIMQLLDKINVAKKGVLLPKKIGIAIKVFSGEKLNSLFKVFRVSKLEAQLRDSLTYEREIVNLKYYIRDSQGFIDTMYIEAVRKLQMIKRQVITTLETSGHRVPPELKINKLEHIITTYDDIEKLIVELRSTPVVKTNSITEFLPLIFSLLSDMKEVQKAEETENGITPLVQKLSLTEIIDEDMVRTFLAAINSEAINEALISLSALEVTMEAMNLKYKDGSNEELERLEYAVALLETIKNEVLTQKVKLSGELL